MRRVTFVSLIPLFLLLASSAWAQEEASGETSPQESPATQTPEQAQADTANATPAPADQPVVNPEPTDDEAPVVNTEPVEEPVEEAPPAEEAPVLDEFDPNYQPPAQEQTGMELDLGELKDLEELSDAQPLEKEQLKFFELNGYFRMRADWFHELDLGVYNRLRPMYDLGTGDSENTNKRKDSDISSANLRLRLNPTLNVSSEIRIKAQIDLLDNLVLGSTPNTMLQGSYNDGDAGQTLSPGINAMSNSQTQPSDQKNALTDSIAVKRIWAEVRTPLGELRFGRMAEHWGTGMFFNDGNCLDCDYGDTVDRLMFAADLYQHVLFGAFDWPSEGLTTANNYNYDGQAKDASNLDDVAQLVFGFIRKDTEAQAEEILENNGFSINYGLYNQIRWQSYTLEQSDVYGATAGDFDSRQALREKMFRRDLKLYTGDIWFRFLWKRLHIELEGAWISGYMDSPALTADDEDQEGVSLNQLGMVFQVDYKFLDDALFTGLEFGLASGDPHPGPNGSYEDGFGADPVNDAQYGRYQRSKNGKWINDRAITNFRFDPDYHVDMILFREIIGCVTDAMYIKPTIRYNITPAIGVQADLIMSMAMEPDSTPSYAHQTLEYVTDSLPVNRKPSRYLGTEMDLKVFYKSFDGFGTQLQYGVFFPGPAMGYWDPNHLSEGVTIPTWYYAPDIAQSLQWHLTVEF